jgi:carboxypeptidase C (cathepsin A)
VRADLGWKKDVEYKIMAQVHPWDMGQAKNQYLDVASKLREVMSKNPKLKVYVASSFNDLATPYFATEYTFSHLDLDPTLRPNLTLKTYEGGHMMYLVYPSLVKMKEDIATFMKGGTKVQ